MQLRVRPTLLIATAALIAVTMTATGVVLHIYVGAIVERLLVRQFDTVAGGAAVQVDTLLDSAVRVLEEQRNRAKLDLLPLHRPEALGRHFAERLRQEPHLAWISYGDLDRDRFIGATRLADGRVLVNISAPEVQGGVPVERIALADGGWRAAEVPPKKPYSVIAQPWFKDALATRDIVVSEPYTFAEGRAGVTLTLRHTDGRDRPRGVFTVDFFLEDLSRGLASLTERGQNDAVLLSPAGVVLANAGAVRPPDLAAAAQAIYADQRAAIDGLAEGTGLMVDANWQDVPYRVAFRQIAGDSGLAVVLALFEPADELFAPAREVRAYVIAITLGATALGLLGTILLAARMARPLHALAESADRIREFDLDRPVEASTWIAEISSLARAMEGMRVGVRNFGLYVPKALVRRLIEAGGAPTLGGERRELTILFSDLAGFTTQSEHMAPEQVMQRISTYFEVMTAALQAHQGVVDKFIGDGIMALWNAPVADPEHARHACRAVLACRVANERLNAALAAEGAAPFPTRFGLHTGEVVVGNLGGEDRIQYTALGAHVNLAARIEALNKHYRTAILVSGATRTRAGEGFLFRFVANAQPAGTTSPVALYELLGAEGDPDAADLAELCSSWSEALARLDAGKLDEALARFEAIAAARPDDSLAAYYCQKVAALVARPPDSHWDGVDRFEHK